MLIVLDDDLCAGDLAPPVAPDVRDAVGRLAGAHREGDHILAYSPRVRRCITAMKDLGDDTLRAFNVASWDLTDATNLRAQVLAYVVVHARGSASRIDVPATPGPGAPLRFHVPLDRFDHRERTMASVLIGEDQRDADFYARLGAAFVARHRSGSTCSFDPVAGGGGNTDRVLERHAARRFTLCVVDSDAGATRQDTANKADIVQRRLRESHHVSELHVLPCHELENLLPPRLLLDAAKDDAGRELIRRHYAALGNADNVDLKELIGADALKRVTDLVERSNAHKLAEYCFARGASPHLATLGELLWSWGVGPPRGKVRV